MEKSERYIETAKVLSAKRVDAKLRAIADATQQRTDEDGVVFAKGQLEELDAAILEVIHRDTSEAFRHFPMKDLLDKGMTSYSYRMEDMVGAAAWVADSSTVRPAVDTFLTKHDAIIREMGVSYNYSISDGERAALQDYDQVVARAQSAAKAIMRLHNDFALDGEADFSVTGFCNNATVEGNAAADSDWSSITTGVARYAVIQALIDSVRNQSGGYHLVNTVAMPLDVWTALQATLLSATGATSATTLQALRENNPGVEFTQLVALADVTGANEDRVMAYEKGPENAEYVASIIYDEAAPDKKGFTFEVQARGKAAGAVVRRPLAMSYVDVQNA